MRQAQQRAEHGDSSAVVQSFAPYHPDLVQPIDRDLIQFSLRRGLLVAVLCSVTLHLLVLFAIPPAPVVEGEGQQVESVRMIAHLKIPKRANAGAGKIPPASASLNTRMTTHPPLRRELPSPSAAPPPREVPPPVPTPALADTPTDLQSFIDAARARRQARGDSRAQSAMPADTGAGTPSEDELRMARVMQNLRPGTSGVFQILNMTYSTAAFSFRGWTTTSSSARREYISVEIGSNPTIEIAIVRRMIELIRRHYSGNFNWESHRLDRVVRLSARIEDTEGLEDFLMQEFFANQRLSRPWAR